MQSAFDMSRDAKAAQKQVSLEDAKAINASLGAVFRPTDIRIIGRLSIEAAARARSSGAVPTVYRRVTSDADFYVQEQISSRKLDALDNNGFTADEGAEKHFSSDRILFLRKRVAGKTIPVQIFQRDVFDHTVTEKGHNIRITHTQDEIMRAAQEVDGLKLPPMPFIVIIKAVAHVERFVRYQSRESELKTDKNGKDIGFILHYILDQTPERFMDENKETVGHMLRGDRESTGTLLKVLREAYKPGGNNGGIRQKLGL